MGGSWGCSMGESVGGTISGKVVGLGNYLAGGVLLGSMCVLITGSAGG